MVELINHVSPIIWLRCLYTYFFFLVRVSIHVFIRLLDVFIQLFFRNYSIILNIILINFINLSRVFKEKNITNLSFFRKKNTNLSYNIKSGSLVICLLTK